MDALIETAIIDTPTTAASPQPEASSSGIFDGKMALLASPDIAKFLFRPSPNLFGRSPFYEKRIKARWHEWPEPASNGRYDSGKLI